MVKYLNFKWSSKWWPFNINNFIFLNLLLSNIFLFGQSVDQSLLNKYNIQLNIKEKFDEKVPFYIEDCDFCEEIKMKFLYENLNVTEKIDDTSVFYKISSNFTIVGLGLKIVKRWTGQISSSEGKIIGFFSFEKKKVKLNARQDYIDRNNCFTYLASEIKNNIQ